MTAQVAADLRAAAEVLRRDGWTQGSYINSRGRCCAVGALMKVAWPRASAETEFSDLSEDQAQRMQAAAEALIAIVKPRDLSSIFWDGPVTRWNDNEAHSADEVIAALEAAADAAEAQP